MKAGGQVLNRRRMSMSGMCGEVHVTGNCVGIFSQRRGGETYISGMPYPEMNALIQTSSAGVK